MVKAFGHRRVRIVDAMVLRRAGPKACSGGLRKKPPPSACASGRSEEHTSELQSLMRISYAVFCLKKKTNNTHSHKHVRNSIADNRLTARNHREQTAGPHSVNR